MFTMAFSKEHIRYAIHFAFHLNKNAAEATETICAAYKENAVSHATCKRWYKKFRQGDFSCEDVRVLDVLRSLTPMNRKHYWMWILHKLKKSLLNSLVLRGKQFLYDFIQWERFRRKADGFRIPGPKTEPKTTKIDVLTPHSLCFQNSGKNIFYIKLLQVMKSGLFMIIPRVGNLGLTLVSLRHRCQSLISVWKKFCSVSGGIGNSYCIKSCYSRVKQLRQTVINNNWPIWAMY